MVKRGDSDEVLWKTVSTSTVSLNRKFLSRLAAQDLHRQEKSLSSRNVFHRNATTDKQQNISKFWNNSLTLTSLMKRAPWDEPQRSGTTRNDPSVSPLLPRASENSETETGKGRSMWSSETENYYCFKQKSLLKGLGEVLLSVPDPTLWEGLWLLFQRTHLRERPWAQAVGPAGSVACCHSLSKYPLGPDSFTVAASVNYSKNTWKPPAWDTASLEKAGRGWERDPGHPGPAFPFWAEPHVSGVPVAHSQQLCCGARGEDGGVEDGGEGSLHCQRQTTGRETQLCPGSRAFSQTPPWWQPKARECAATAEGHREPGVFQNVLLKVAAASVIDGIKFLQAVVCSNNASGHEGNTHWISF